MIRASMDLSEQGFGWFQYAPTNLLLAAIRYRRRGLKWGIPAMLILGGSYVYATAICYTIINNGGPGWLNLLVFLFGWNALKFMWIGPVSLSVLVYVRALERAARQDASAGEDEGDQKGTTTMQTMQSVTCDEVA